MRSLLEVLRASDRYLAERGVPDARREAEQLLMGVLGLDRLDLYCRADTPLEETELQRLRPALDRRGRREPLAYILGQVEFGGLGLRADARALIPRLETEFLVEQVVRVAQGRMAGEGLAMRILDLCTGSGCIALALKRALPQATICASDLSLEALELARENGGRLGLEVEWRQGDLEQPWLDEAPFDLVVCNPPYVAEDWRGRLEPEVAKEPELALFAGEEGMDIYRRLANVTPVIVAPAGELWLEIGFDQGEKVTQTFASLGRTTLLQDLAAHDRFFRLEVEAP